MSEFDNVRRRAQGLAARESVKNRLSGVSSPSAAPVSEFDGIRNRSVAPVSVTVPNANPMIAPQTVTPLDFLHVQQATIAKPSFTVSSPSSPIAPSTDPGAQELAARDASRAGAPKLLQKFGHAMDKFMLTTKPGRWLTGFNRGAEETLTGVQSASPDVGGKGAYITGSLVGGAAINPAALEQSLVKGGYDLAAGALSTRLGSKAVGKLGQVIEGAPGVSANTAQRLATTGARGAIAGAYQNVGLSAAAGHTSPQEIGEAAVLGGALGGAGDTAVSGLASVLRRYRGSAANPETIDKLLALPEPRARGQANVAETPDVINVPESGPRGLPEPSAEEAARWRNINESQVEISAIDDELRALESRYQQAVNDQYKYLKQSMVDRGGVEQGALLRNEAGDVTGRLGRQSNNPEWYQEFYRTNGRAPNNKELFALAKQHVDEGFTDGGQQLPSWRAENGYDETVAALQQVKGQLQRAHESLTSGKVIPEPNNLQELLRARGMDDTPENIARVYNTKNWYHGTGTDKLTAEMLDPFVGSHESLFGQGVYLTDNPSIAEGYANSRGRRSKTPTVYELNTSVNRVLDLEKPPSPEAADALRKSVQSLDYAYEREFEEANHFTKLLDRELGQGATTEQIIQVIRGEIESFSHEAGISTNSFVEDMQELAINLKKAGYDGLTHTGGHRTGKDPHRVLILLDPQNWHGTEDGPRQVSRMDKYQPKAEPAMSPIVSSPAAAPQSVPARAPGVDPIPGTGRQSAPRAAEPRVVSSPEHVKTQPPKVDSGPLGFAAGGGKNGKFTNPTDTRTYIETKTSREPFDIAGMADDFYRKNVDNLQRINQLDKYVEEIMGKPLPADQKAYVQALNTRGADVIAKHILTERMVDAKGNAIGEALKDITKQIPRRSYTNFLDYLIARHAETRMGRGETVYDRRVGMTAEMLADKIRTYQDTYPEFEGIADQLYAWNDKLGQAWLVDTGIIPADLWTVWKDANPYWVPNKRYFSKLEQSGRPPGKARRGFAGQGNPVKSYSPTGSERPIIDPIESIIEYVDKYVKTAKRNEVMQTVIKHLNEEPEALQGFAELVPENQNMHQSSLNAINNMIKDEGIESLLEKLDGEFEAAYNKNQKERVAGRGNIVTGMVEGNPVQVQVNDIPLLEALANLTPQTSNAVVEAARKVTNAMKLLTTGVNPVFSLTRNIWRDIPTAYIFSKTTNNPFRFAWDLLDGVVSTFGNKELYQRYKAVGGGHSSPVAADRNLLSQAKRELLPQQKKGMGLLPRAYGALENLSNVIESAPRVGEFKRITKAGGDSYASRQEGLFQANDLTTNFKRKGSTIKDADAFLPYLNAAVQGLDKTVRAFKDNPGAVSAKAFLAITVPTIGLYAINHGRQDYQELSNYTKDNFFLIPRGDGQFIKIPRPRELGIPFGALLERTMRAWADEDPESFRDFADTVTTAFAPPGIPAKELAHGDFMGAAIAPVRDTVLGPIVDVASNENFAGAPIVPQYLEGVSPRYQFDANTSEVGKKIGDVLNVSPKQVDHLIRSYTGVLGQLGLPATSQGATVGETLTKQVTADSVFSNDATGDFYELKDRLGRKYADIKLTGDIPPGYNDALRKYIDQTASDIGDVTKAIRAVDKMPLSAGEKKDKKRELTELRNDTARRAYIAVRDQMKK
ncbi:LPD38 domain-containing protein [Cohnella sp. 56]|uniref:LPD38 domain-containing protein n=1 Tax=Cohnella sp. 56 TaxID=3113722 RepID=UPI0030E964B1